MKINLFDAVIFDLDGVITKTALVHSVAWKEMFDEYLRFREVEYGEPFREFSHEDDYLPYVDGKPRYKGVADFLASRMIEIPFGDPGDNMEKETVCGLGNRKNKVFNDILDRDGVQMYDSTVELIRELKAQNIRIGVASSSKNCKPVLEAAGLMHYFETRVDGVISAEIGLKGKPEPDIFTTACDNLGVKYHRSVVVEDAVSGVQAGRKGKFGLVIGVAREGNSFDLKKNGADLVVEDISQLGGVDAINKWFSEGLIDDQWSVSYPDYTTENEKSRETLLAVGNGFFASRGAMEETSAGEINYPGSYMSGLFNRRKSKVGDRMIENEDFVNFINWIHFSFRINNGEWFDPNKHDFEIIERKLDFRTGVLSRKIMVKAEEGTETLVNSRRFVSMADQHIAGIEYEVTPLNYSGMITLSTSIDGDLINNGVDRYKQLDQHHLDQVDVGVKDKLPFVTVRTNQSAITITAASRLVVKQGSADTVNSFHHNTAKGKVSSCLSFQAERGKPAGIQKVVVVFNNRDFNVKDTLKSAIDKLSSCNSFEEEIIRSRDVWTKIWEEADVKVEADRYAQKLLRLHIYHLVITASHFHKNLDAAIPARGLHGEAYRGHIFWDELYMFPFYVSHFPETARSVLMYRYRRLPEARKNAKQHNYKGAMYPWQSGSDGREETQVVHLNPVSGEWGDDHSSRQRHVSIAIAYNIWMYYHMTSDHDFMSSYGAEIFLEIVRFWASISEKEENTGRYSISGVMGPDEFHEKYPDATGGGLKNNAYTNIMAAWCMEKAFEFLEGMPEPSIRKVLEKIQLNETELEHWKEVSENLKVSISEEGVIEQFEGYFRLKELDWPAYKEKYGNIHRLDRILKAEEKSPDDYKVAKQADTLMIFYLIGMEKTSQILSRLGYRWKADMMAKNYDYYINRTSHGSTLSRVVHSRIARMAGHPEQCFNLYMEALESDYVDIQGGTTAEGIHAGVMGGTILSAMTLFAGLNWLDETLILDPFLPKDWESVSFRFHFKNAVYHFHVCADKAEIEFYSDNKEDGRIKLNGELKVLQYGKKNVFLYS